MSDDEPRENPRTRRVRRLILDAALDLLLTRGAGDVTAARVAEEAGVARTTIYRHWPEPSSLLLATIEELVAPHAPAPDTGDVRADLRAALDNLRTRLTTRRVRAVFAALVGHAAHDEAFVAAQRRFIEGLMQPTLDTLSAAQQHGELPARLDCTMGAALLTGPMFHQHLVMHGSIDDRLIEEIASQFLETHAP